MKAENKKFIPIAMLVIGAAFVYGNGKGTSLGPITMFSVGPAGAEVTWETEDVGVDQVLQRTFNLADDPVVWEDVTDGDVIAAGTNTVSDAELPLSPIGFYRIRQIEVED